jgi:hypothetical protein
MLFDTVDAAFGHTVWNDRRSTVEFDGGPLLLSLEYAGRAMCRPLRMLRPAPAARPVTLILTKRNASKLDRWELTKLLAGEHRLHAPFLLALQ